MGLIVTGMGQISSSRPADDALFWLGSQSARRAGKRLIF